MKLQDSISLVTQIENGQILDSGIQFNENQVIGLNKDLGLMILALGEPANALKAVEIMIDDMQLNYTAKVKMDRYSTATGKQCMLESIDNINEYLYFQAQKNTMAAVGNGIQLAAIQLHKNQFSCSSLGEISVLKFSDNNLTSLTLDSSTQIRLGIDTSLKPEVVEQSFSVGDILLLTTRNLIGQLGPEFIRLTLSRFNENLDMVIRQINTRVSRENQAQKPTIILCRMNRPLVQRQSWFNKFRKN